MEPQKKVYLLSQTTLYWYYLSITFFRKNGRGHTSPITKFYFKKKKIPVYIPLARYLIGNVVVYFKFRNQTSSFLCQTSALTNSIVMETIQLIT